MNIYQKVWKLLTQSQKLSGVGLILLTVIGAIFEAAGIGLIVPFISIIADDNFELPNSVITILPVLNSLDSEEIILFVVSLFLIFYLFKSLFLLYLAALQAGYYIRLQESISTRLFGSYLKRPYTFHLQHNSAKLLSNTMTESLQFAVGFIAPAVLAVNDILITVMIMLVLLFMEPSGAVVAFILFGTMSLILFKASKTRAALWGETRQKKERLRIKSAQQGFGGVKDIKLYARESIFESRYAEDTHISLDAGRKQTILQNVPRVFLEFVAVFSLCVLVVFVNTNGDKANMIAIIGLFAAAAFKLLPTMSRLVQSSQAMVFTRPVVSFIYSELMENEHLYSFNNKSRQSLESDVSFDGPNIVEEQIEGTDVQHVNSKFASISLIPTWPHSHKRYPQNKVMEDLEKISSIDELNWIIY